ncbi:MAG: hypothetical protein Fur0025_20500 [Oscillatoriaceae cyanobacterium]
MWDSPTDLDFCGAIHKVRGRRDAVRPYALRAGYANGFAQDRLRSPTG